VFLFLTEYVTVKTSEGDVKIPYPTHVGELRGQPYYTHDFKRKFKLHELRMRSCMTFGVGEYLRRGSNPVLAIGARDKFMFTLSKSGVLVFRHEEGKKTAFIMYMFIYLKLLEMLNNVTYNLINDQ
jgi:hypothetical protein